MTALGHHYSVYYRKMLVRLWYMLNRTLKTNVEPRWPLKSNLELRWPPFVCHVIWAVFATRNARTFVRSEDSEPFVRRTSRMKKRAYERILTFGTAQSNTPNSTAYFFWPCFGTVISYISMATPTASLAWTCWMGLSYGAQEKLGLPITWPKVPWQKTSSLFTGLGKYVSLCL